MSFLSFSPCCVKGGILPGVPRGDYDTSTLKKVGGYHVNSSDGMIGDGKVALVIFADIFGLQVPNCQILADGFSDELKCHVFVPDYIPNPPPNSAFTQVAKTFPEEYANRPWYISLIEWIKTIFKAWKWIPTFLFQGNQIRLAQAAVDNLITEGYTTIMSIGYCRGATILEYLLSSSSNVIQCAVLCHPEPKPRLYNHINRPTIWNIPDHDTFFKSNEVDILKRIMGKKVKDQGLEFECFVHKDTVHGFANRPTLDHEATKIAFEKVNNDAIEFFKRHLLQ
ncbi:uncharacterized protein IL334_006552 [Kwoniella shivajii]|uniref:Dienelactone hydrolase domain-containing protein n=1 Tax=Kwoniella shivajii TaxID=564305 RepID=A0ABZ1D6A4_9TREE|nr:hypothetical protein IL334_006552 [Kwoniella shivajii]